jgi:hypothetical protein
MADFGIGEIIAAISSIGSTIAGGLGAAGTAIAGGAEAIGIPAALAGPLGAGVVDAGVGAGLGATEAAITGQPIGKGAEFGAIGGGIFGAAAPALGAMTGSALGGDVLAGALGGAAGGAATHGNILQDALMGGAGGLASGLMSGAPLSGGGGGTGAAGAAAPPGTSLDPAATGNFTPNSATGTMGVDASGLTNSGPFGNITPSADITGGGASAVSGNLPGDFGTGAAGTGLGETGLGGAGGGLTSAADLTKGITTGLTPPTDYSGLKPSGGLFGGNANKLLMGGALGLDLLKGNQQPPGYNALNTSANKMAAQGAQFQNYLASGTLPPSMQESLNAAGESAKATIRSEYASRGQSGSSAEAQDVSGAGQRVAAQGEQLAMQLFQSGVSEMGVADQIYTDLMKVQMQQDQQMTDTIAGLAGMIAKTSMGAQPGG